MTPDEAPEARTDAAADARPAGPGAGGDGDPPDLLAVAVERMAHELKNPLQAVAINLEVIRGRLRREAPELWEGLERFGQAVDDNVGLLDRRLRLLLALGRRGPDAELREADPAALARDLAAALRLDEEPPGVDVPAGEGAGGGLAARLRPGHVLALLLDAWLAAARAGAEHTPVEVRRSSDAIGLAFRLPATATAGRDRWAEAARSAGGTLELDEGGEGTILRVSFPTA